MKILIVDDSVVFRSAIKTSLLNSGYVNDVNLASNGKIAVAKLQQSSFDGVTLDLEMPVMDGLETIKEIRKFDTKIPIIIFSAQNLNAADKTINALQLGANDFVQKDSGLSDLNENMKMIENDLVPRFKALLGEKSLIPVRMNTRKDLSNIRPNVLCLASSTGGPEALIKVFTKLEKLVLPVLITQHMP